MPTNILMPALSPTMEEGGLTKWLVKEGDKVAAGDLIAEIETDKAVMEVEAADDGRIGKLLVPEGAEGIKVHAVIAILLGEGEEISAAETIAKASPSLMASPTGGRRTKKTRPPDALPEGKRTVSDRSWARGRRQRKAPLNEASRVRRRLCQHAALMARMAIAYLHRRLPAVWPRKPASASPQSTAPDRMAVLSKPTSLRCKRAARQRRALQARRPRR